MNTSPYPYPQAINDEQSGTRLAGLQGLRSLLDNYDPRVDSIVSELTNQLKAQRSPAHAAADPPPRSPPTNGQRWMGLGFDA